MSKSLRWNYKGEIKMAIIKPEQRVVTYYTPGGDESAIQKDIENWKDWYIHSITPIYGYSGVIVLWIKINQ